MHDDIKKATLKSKTGDIIPDNERLLNRWVKHYLELYAIQNVVTCAATNTVPDLSIKDDLSWRKKAGTRGWTTYGGWIMVESQRTRCAMNSLNEWHQLGAFVSAFTDICKRDMKLANVDINIWEQIANDRKTIARGGVRKANETR